MNTNLKRAHHTKPFSDLIEKAGIVLSAKEDILFSYVFGSAASGRTHAMSDLDIAVYLRGNRFQEKRMEILGDLIDSLKMDEIDLVVLNTAPLPLKARIIRSKRLLSDRTPFVRHAFESATVRAYLDFSRMEAFILQRRYLHGR